MTKAKAAAVTAFALIGAIIGGGLTLLYELKGKPQAVWPFPKTARILPGIAEVILWLAVVCAVLFLVWFVFAKLFIAAGWWNPDKSTRTCPRCYGKGEVRS